MNSYMFSPPQSPPVNLVIEEVLSDIDPSTYAKILQQISMPIEKLICPKKNLVKEIPQDHKNSFVIYRRDFMARVKLNYGHEISSNLPFVSTKAAKWWGSENPEVKNTYQIIADLARKVHIRIYPDYVFQPKKRANNNNKYTLKEIFFENIPPKKQPQQQQIIQYTPPSPPQSLYNHSIPSPPSSHNNSYSNSNYSSQSLPSINHLLLMTDNNYDRRMCRSLRGPY